MSLFVHKKELAEDAAFWVSNSENYTLLLLARWYGVVVVLVILALLAILAGMLVFTLRRQKNRLGVLVGAGCIWVLSVMVLIHTLVNFGLLPATDCSLPFFSANGKEGLVIYGLMGILLSVFRTTATLPEPKAQKNLFGWKLELVRTKQ